MSVIDAKIPAGPLKDKWSAHKAHIGVVSPANKKKLDVIIVGTGLAGGSAAASLAQCNRFLLSGFSPSCTLYRRTGRYQRSQKLSQR